MQNRYGSVGVYQYRSFGGFRLLLAVLVMVQHFGADLAPAPLATALAPYFTESVAVLVFFALSGFVITEAVDSVYRNRPIPFLTNRLLRIVPHFLLALIFDRDWTPRTTDYGTFRFESFTTPSFRHSHDTLAARTKQVGGL